MKIETQANEVKLHNKIYDKCDKLEIEKIKKQIDSEYNAKQQEMQLEKMIDEEMNRDNHDDELEDDDIDVQSGNQVNDDLF